MLRRSSSPWSLVAVVLAVALGACGSDDRPPVGQLGAGTIPASVPVGLGIVDGPCAHEGQVVECRAVWAHHGTIEDCFVGTQRCKDHVWTPCQGDSTDAAAPGP